MRGQTTVGLRNKIVSVVLAPHDLGVQVFIGGWESGRQSLSSNHEIMDHLIIFDGWIDGWMEVVLPNPAAGRDRTGHDTRLLVWRLYRRLGDLGAVRSLETPRR